MRHCYRGSQSLFVAVIAVTSFSTLGIAQAGKKSRPIPLSAARFDPSAKQVDIFEAIDEKSIDVQVIPKDEFGGNILVSNPGEEPLTVKVPAGFVALPVLAQFGGAGGLGGGGYGGGTDTGGGGGGQQQAMGGGMMGGGMGGMMGGGMMGGGGMGMFSVPPETTVRVAFTSVCLEHGKPAPNPRVPYRLVRMEDYTKDPLLQKLIVFVGTGKLDKASAQAAAWHVANGMSWAELAAKQQEHIRSASTPYFSFAQLQYAQQLVGIAVAEVKKDKEGELQVSAPVEPLPDSPRARLVR